MKKIITTLSILSFAFLFGLNVHAANIVVDSELLPVALDGKCSFEEAITSAENDVSVECTPGVGDDVITFAPGLGDIILSPFANIQITKNIIIQGAADGTVIDEGSASLYIEGNATASNIEMHDLELKGSVANPGISIGSIVASPVDLVITFDNVHIHDNGGGGISYTKDFAFNRNIKVYVNNSLIENNTGFTGGGIYINECNLGLSDIQTKENITRIGTSPSGIPIYTFTYKKGFSHLGENDKNIYVGTMAQDLLGDFPYAVVRRSNGFYSVNYHMIDVDFKLFKAEKYQIAEKNIIDEKYTLEINNSVIRNNTSLGGGVYNDCGHVKINQSTISGNTATGFGGGVYISQGGNDFGGNYKTTLTEIYNSTITGNTSGAEAGGIYLFNNDVVNYTPELIIKNTTITNNSSVGPMTAAGVFIENGIANIYNTIIGDNTGGTNQCRILNPLTNSLGNASTDASCGAGFIASVVTGLGALADNGGILPIGPNGLLGNILTMAITNTSALFDTGDVGECLADDQIGTNRPQGAGCDIGAFEALVVTPPASSGGSSRKSGSRRVSKKKLAEIFGNQTQEAAVVEETMVEDITEELPNCPIFTQHMRKGDRDGKTGQEKQESGVSRIIDEIKLLQTKLTELGFDAGSLDGVFGTKTENGVRAFQQAHFNEVLKPWGLTHTTGRFYQSSERWMNEVLGCRDTVTIDKGVYLDSAKK